MPWSSSIYQDIYLKTCKHALNQNVFWYMSPTKAHITATPKIPDLYRSGSIQVRLYNVLQILVCMSASICSAHLYKWNPCVFVYVVPLIAHVVCMLLTCTRGYKCPVFVHGCLLIYPPKVILQSSQLCQVVVRLTVSLSVYKSCNFAARYQEVVS